MKIILPESIADIKLYQFQKYNTLLERIDLDEYQFNKRKIEIFTGLERKRLDLISQTDYEEIITQIDIALNQTVEFTPTFKMQDVEFGFIPNLDKITTGEYRDLSIYGTDINEMHKLMAVLFRPIIKKDIVGNYSIIDYEGTERYANIMLSMPLSIVNGSLVFFSSLASELVNYTQRFIVVEQVKEKAQVNILKSGDGMLRYLNYVKAKFGILRRFLKQISTNCIYF